MEVGNAEKMLKARTIDGVFDVLEVESAENIFKTRGQNYAF